METRLRWHTAALIGVLSVAAALAAGHLVAAFVSVNASPFLAVGNTAIDLTPGWLKDFAIATFGVNDKLALLVGMAFTILILAIAAGLLSRRSPVPGTLLAVVLGGLALAAVLARPDLGPLAILAPIASLIAGIGVFQWLHKLAMESAGDTPAERAGLDRRKFLITTGGVAAGIGLFGLGGQFLGNRVDAEGSRQAIGAVTGRAAPAIPASAAFTDAGTPTFITPLKQFYKIDTTLTVPKLRAEDWNLRVHGLVDNELNLDYDDIRGRELIDKVITMTCVSNEIGGNLISTAVFTGIPLRDVLMEAGVQPEAGQVFATSVDGWTTATPVRDMMDAERGAMLAIGMNGEPLPLNNGFPVRIVVPGLYGYVSATKWLVDLELIRDGEKTFYWQDRGWAKEAPIKTMSRIDSPTAFQALPAGKVTIAGIAWAQTVGIDKVEVRLDGGNWQATTLAAEVNDRTWRMWKTDVDLRAGSHRVEVRATDRSGYTQTDERVAPIPDGATGWHSILFNVE